MQVNARLLLGSKTFGVTVALFLAANLWSWLRPEILPDCCLDEITVGFPFPFHITRIAAASATFYPLGLTLDLVVMLTIAVIATRIAYIGGAD